MPARSVPTPSSTTVPVRAYPDALLDDLLDGVPRVVVLDVGCGTGIVSRLLAARGCRVLGVEPDARMAAVARSRGVVVEEATFEDWDPAGRLFDLLSSGQAWHWIDPVVGAAKAAAALAPGGRVGLFWNQGIHQPDVKRVIDDVYGHIAPGLDGHSILLGASFDGRLRDARVGLSGTGSFEVPTVGAYQWERAYSRDEWLDQLPTHSDHRTLPADQLAALLAALGAAIEALGGGLTLSYTTWLLTTRRRGVRT